MAELDQLEIQLLTRTVLCVTSLWYPFFKWIDMWQEQLYPAWTRGRKPHLCCEINFIGQGLNCLVQADRFSPAPASITWRWCSQQRPGRSPTSHWPHYTQLWDAEALLELFQHPGPANFGRGGDAWIESVPLSAGCALPASLWTPGARQVWCNLSWHPAGKEKKRNLQRKCLQGRPACDSLRGEKCRC